VRKQSPYAASRTLKQGEAAVGLSEPPSELGRDHPIAGSGGNSPYAPVSPAASDRAVRIEL